MFRGLRAVRISPEAPRLLMSSCISASGTVNQRPFGARGLSMRGETIRRDLGGGRPGTRPRHSAGPPRETFAHATPCRKTPYARGKTRTPRPRGQGVHSEPVSEPLSRSPLEVVPRRPRSDNRNPPAGELPGSLGGTNPIHRSQTSFQKRLRAPLAGPSRKSPDSGSHPSGSNGAQPSASEGPARNGGGGGRLNSLHCAPTYWPASALRGRPLSAAQSSPAPADQVMIFGRSWC